jgi:ferric-dicitrate binding protein FerR (iron transport regulator)
MNRIEDLLKKFREDSCTEKELEALNNYLNIPNYDDTVGYAMYEHWNKCDNSPIGDEERFKQILSEIHHAINVKNKQETGFKRFYLGFSRIAAILILPLMLSLFLMWQHQKSNEFALENTISVPLGARSEFLLSDGTQVMLNSGSKLTYPLSFKNNRKRIVALNGEGYFKVKKDANSPFIVRMNDIDLKVTGTEFNARAYCDESNLIVALVEGSVILGNENAKKFDTKKAMKPQDVFVMNKTSKRMELFHSIDLTKYIAWTNGRTVFDNDPIQTVIEKLEKLYNVKVKIEDKELMNYRLTATFTNEPLERALKIISLSSPISYRIISDKKESEGIFDQRLLILSKNKESRAKSQESR